MSVQTKTTLKSYFETGDKPTQSQFANLIDTMATVTDLPNGVPLNEPIPVDASITVSDIGKLAMLDYDGNIKLYKELGGAATKAKLKLTFTAVSEPNLPFKFTDANGQIDTTTNAWLTGVTTAAEEAAAFMSYINTNFGTVLVITAGTAPNELIFEQASIGEITEWPELANISGDMLVAPQLETPLVPKKICVGVIKNVNETNHTATFEDIIVLNKVSSPNVNDVLTEAQTKEGTAYGLNLMKLIAVPTNGGSVRAITATELADNNWTTTCLQNALYFFIKPHADSNKFYCLKRGLS